MTSFTSDLQLHGNLTQGKTLIQFIFFFCQHFLFLFSYLCPTLPVMDHQNICISFFFVRNFWFHPKTIIIKILFCLLYLYIGYKTDPYGDINVGRFVFEDKGYYKSMSSPKSTFMDFFKWTKYHSSVYTFKTWALLPKSDVFTPS